VPGKVAAGPAVGTWLREAAEAIRGIDAGAVERAAAILVETRNGDGTIFVAGNGGARPLRPIWRWTCKRPHAHLAAEARGPSPCPTAWAW